MWRGRFRISLRSIRATITWPTLGAMASSRKSEQPRRIVGEYALPHGGVGGPIHELVVKLDGADLIVEGKVREVAAPDHLAGRRRDQRLGERLDVGISGGLRKPVDARELRPAPRGAVADQRQKIPDALLRRAFGRREEYHMGNRER